MAAVLSFAGFISAATTALAVVFIAHQRRGVGVSW